MLNQSNFLLLPPRALEAEKKQFILYILDLNEGFDTALYEFVIKELRKS